MVHHHKVIVIGAGITGLTVAQHLKRNGIDVAVLEKQDHTGGTMTTLRKDGWIVERGPNSGLETTPLLKELFTELAITDKLIYANDCADKRYILRNGDLHPVPMSPVSFLTSRLWSVWGKLRIFKEPWVGKADKEETISEFVTRRLGRELLDYAINPFVAGVFAGDPSRLSVQSAFPKLYALEEKYGGLIKGTILGARERKKRAEKAKDRSRQFSFSGGMQTLPEAITAYLGEQVLCGVNINSIRKHNDSDGRRFKLEFSSNGESGVFETDVIVFAVPSWIAGEMIREFDKTLADELVSIYYPPVTEVFLGYRKEQIRRTLDGFGFLIPEKEKRKILGTIWSSTIFTDRAPEGHEGLTTFVGGSRQPGMASLPDNELIDTVNNELTDIMHIRGEPAMSFINRWERAIPQYQLGHGKIIKHIEAFENSNTGIILGGNYRGGISVSDCIISSKRIYEQVQTLLS